MILRTLEAGEADRSLLERFACSTGSPFEDEVEDWIRSRAFPWLNDIQRARFQRRVLALVEDAFGETVAVVAWQDIVRIDIEGIWLEVLAVDLDHQHGGAGRSALGTTLDRLRDVDRNGDHIARLVHPDNTRSQRLLATAGWSPLTTVEGHELWVGRL